MTADPYTPAVDPGACDTEIVRLTVRLPAEVRTTLHVLAAHGRTTVQALVLDAIDTAVLGGGVARAIRCQLEAVGALTCHPGRAREVDAALAAALVAARTPRGRPAAVVEALESCPAVVEVYGDDRGLLVQVRRAIARSTD